MDRMETERKPLREIEARAVGVGAVGGFVAGIGMGLIVQFGTDLLPVLGALAGELSVLRGWLVHLLISVLYGVFFAVVVAYPPVQDFIASFGVSDYVLAGITYAVMMAAVSIAVLPFVFELPWVAAASRHPSPRVPGPALGGLIPAAVFGVGHIVYGAILGAVYALLGERAD